VPWLGQPNTLYYFQPCHGPVRIHTLYYFRPCHGSVNQTQCVTSGRAMAVSQTHRITSGRAMAQVLSCDVLTWKPVQSPGTECRICGGQGATRPGQCSPVSTIPPCSMSLTVCNLSNNERASSYLPILLPVSPEKNYTMNFEQICSCAKCTTHNCTIPPSLRHCNIQSRLSRSRPFVIIRFHTNYRPFVIGSVESG
jgi:hypothetical protein